MPYRYDQPDNLVTLIEDSVAKFPQNPLFGTKNADGSYEWVTYQEVGRRIDNLRAGMGQRGIGKGDAVGIIAPNCTEWAVAAFATYGAGGQIHPHVRAGTGQRQICLSGHTRGGNKIVPLGGKCHDLWGKQGI